MLAACHNPAFTMHSRLYIVCTPVRVTYGLDVALWRAEVVALVAVVVAAEAAQVVGQSGRRMHHGASLAVPPHLQLVRQHHCREQTGETENSAVSRPQPATARAPNYIYRPTGPQGRYVCVHTGRVHQS